MSSHPFNDDPGAAALRERIEQWRRAEPVLRGQRERDIRNADTQASVAWFDGVFRALGPDTSRRDLGLVEQQRLFAKLRRQ
ncbi:MAG: hypothetical protein JJU00_16785 [Opitutales bacterium]|nr:hypothetical protein [Opitutales bacterium]